jgi:hypothetical protein
MARYDAIFKLTWGGTVAFQLRGYRLKRTPQYGESGTRLGTEVSISGTGWVEATSTAALSTAIAALLTAADKGGVDLSIVGVGGVAELSIPAAACTGGGPHMTLELGPGDSMLDRSVAFEITASQQWDSSGGGGGGGGGDPGYEPAIEQSTTSKFDQDNRCIQVRVTGTSRGAGAADFVGTNTIPGMALSADPMWERTFEISSNFAGDEATYSAAFDALLVALPRANDTSRAISAEMTQSIDVDGFRRVETTAYEMVYVGNADEIVAALRPKAGVIIKWRQQQTSIKQRQLRVEWVVLKGAAGNDLLEWERRIEIPQEAAVYEQIEYTGANPVYVARLGGRQVTESGRAVGLRTYIAAPSPLLSVPDQALHAAAPMISRAAISEHERETSWRYQMWIENGVVLSPSQLAALSAT